MDKTCISCGEDMSLFSESDIKKYLCSRADSLGMESLTEEEQLVVEGKLCDACYVFEEGWE